MILRKLPNKLIGEVLIEEGFLDSEHLQKGLEIQKKEGGLIGEILIREGWLSEEELVMGLSKQLGLPFIQLSNYNVNKEALKKFPKEWTEQYLFFPFDTDEKTLSLAMSNPLDQEAVGLIEKQVTLPIQLFLAKTTEIKRAIEENYAESLSPTQKG